MGREPGSRRVEDTGPRRRKVEGLVPGEEAIGVCNGIGGTSGGQGALRWWCTVVVCGGIHSLLIPTPKRRRKNKDGGGISERCRKIEGRRYSLNLIKTTGRRYNGDGKHRLPRGE